MTFVNQCHIEVEMAMMQLHMYNRAGQLKWSLLTSWRPLVVMLKTYLGHNKEVCSSSKTIVINEKVF